MLLGNNGSAIISNEKSANIIAESEIVSHLDLGHSVMYVLKHPVYKDVVVLNSCLDNSGILKLNA